ncbi:hypothetical protein GCM10010260_17350 [Streptomyces filipinensis]|uniref:Uncharacterized protein n=1 Tax=Streptomyces filipinensis TaxID=66887 RepID=A0A918M938_9ACTN|nr:TetR family transcriptional regulator [Streptomyces filipinensis]GGU85163.1 hypothetical protein GCM10010260_17350 [Streptomyces filipinensis]
MNAARPAVPEDPARSGADRIRALFALVLDGDADNRPQGHGVGRLTVDTTVERAARDAVAAGMLERDTARRLAALRAAVGAGRRDGSVTSARDAGDLPRFVNATAAGLRVSAQGGADRAALQAVAAIALDAPTACAGSSAAGLPARPFGTGRPAADRYRATGSRHVPAEQDDRAARITQPWEDPSP